MRPGIKGVGKGAYEENKRQIKRDMKRKEEIGKLSKR
jgi:hypothetical protein